MQFRYEGEKQLAAAYMRKLEAQGMAPDMARREAAMLCEHYRDGIARGVSDAKLAAIFGAGFAYIVRDNVTAN